MKRTILISSLVLLYVVGLSSAATRNVPADYPTIQAAINAAVDGVDDVNVADSIYTGAGNYNLNFGGKAIAVRSANGPANCIIDCQGLGRGFHFFNGEGASSVVDGFTIINGNVLYGGAIECYRSSPRIFGCVIKDNHADIDGGGIACFESSSTINNCLFVNNSAGDFGGAINCDGSSASITLCTFSGNTAAGAGGGIYCYYDADATIKYSIFQDCGSHAIFEDDIDSDPLVRGCLFFNNPDGDYYDYDTALTYTGGIQINALSPDNIGNKDGDPLFRTGPLGDYYQSQKNAGQLEKGPGVDGGDIYAVDAGMDIYTTATNGLTDWRGLDLGYHYIPATVPQYTLSTGVVGGNGTMTPDPAGNPHGPYDQFTEVLLIADPCVGYKVRQWTGTDDDLSKEPNNVVTITENKTVSVEFEPRATFQLTTIVVGGLGGTIDPPTGPQYEGDRVLLTATPELGYTVEAWTGTEDDSSLALTNYVTMDSDKTVTVEFIYSNVYLDTAVIGGHGRIRPRSGSYPVDLLGLHPVELTAIPDYGYHVKQWGGDAEGVPFLDPNDPTHNAVKMTESKSVTVEFETAPLFDLTLSVIGGHGTLVPTYPAPVDYDPVSGIYTYYNGAVVTIEATPDTGYRLKQWGGDVDNPSATGLTNTVTIRGHDANATVEFEGIPQVWVYKPDGTLRDGPFETIQAGINHAYSGFPGFPGDPEATPLSLPEIAPVVGDTVVVSDGVYTESDLDFSVGTGQGASSALAMTGHLPGRDVDNAINLVGDSKRITVRSENGPENCIIDCGGADRGFFFYKMVEDNNCVVEGFTIRGGQASLGGGAYCRGISAPVFKNCIFTGNSAVGGGGLYLEGVADGDTSYTDLVEVAEGLVFGYDMALIDDPNLIEDTGFQNRYRAASIWAIMLDGIVDYATSGDEPNMPLISNCKITANTSDSHGGGIYCTANTAPLIITSEITGNLAGHAGLPGAHGGGIYCEDEDTTPAIINCLIAGNISTEIGGAMYIYESAPVINLCTIANNYGLHYEYMPDGVTPIPIGGIAAREADPTITNCIIGRNGTAGTWGDGYSYGDDLYPDELTAAFSCIENPDDAEGNIDDDPLFITGGLGNYYLFQEHFDYTENSPCVDTGEQYVLVNLQGPPPDGYNLDLDITTSVRNNYDFGFTDMGYHYPFYTGPPVMYRLRINVTGSGIVNYYQGGSYLGTITSGGSDVHYFLPGTRIRLEAHPDPNHWGYWHGTDDDESFNTWNNVTMYGDRDVTVEFEPILNRKLHVPADYALLQDAIDAAKYRDTIVLAAGGANNPYFTSQGFVVRNNKAITITSADPNDPDTVAATVIAMETPQDGGWVSRAFTFINVGSDTVLNGITIRGFNWSAMDGLDGDEELEPGENGSSAYGGAILCLVASPTIKNCVIEDCSVYGGDGGDGMPGTAEHPDGMAGGWPGAAGGAGLACFYNSNPAVINCTFDDCNAFGGNGGDGGDGQDDPPGPHGLGGRGGGWYYGTDSYWYNVPWPRGPYEFYTEYSGRGGAVYVGEHCSPKFIYCTFSSNSSEGGLCGICGLDGVPQEGRQKPGLRWKIDNFGAAVFCDDDSRVEFDNCSFINNLASPNRPTRDFNEPYDPETNYDNDDIFVGFGGAVAFKTGADVTFNECRFERNLGDKGGAIHCRDAKPQINDCSFVGNSAQTGGAVLFARGYGRIARSDFIENEAIGAVGRGGAICTLGSNALIVDCNISNNIAFESGGAAYISSKDVDGNDLVIEGESVFGYNKVVFFNSLIAKNTACDDGGGISANYESEPDIISCTIADNAVLEECGSDIGYGGGLISTTGSLATVLDSIIWGNSADLGSQIAIGITPSPSVIEVVASDVQGAQSNAYIGTGSTLDWDPNNLYTDPLFVSGPLGGYYLSQIVTGQLQESPCVDAGSDLAVRVGMNKYTTRTDEVFDGGIVDMGYHHSFTTLEQPCKFCNLSDDGIINFADFAVFALRWLDEGCIAGNNWCLEADLTFDTRVNIDDLLVFAECWLVEDTTPPDPNPSRWKRKPYSASMVPPYTISMTAKPAVDIWSETVEYYFDCAYGNCHDQDWSSSNTYTDTGLVGFTEYGYRVKARDGSGNETDWSSTNFAIAGTEPPVPEDHNAPVPDPMTWAVAPHSSTAASIAMTATTAVDLEGSGVEYYFECVTDDVNSGWIDIPTWEDTNLAPSTTYAYRVKARDTSLWQNETGWSILLGATTGIEDTETPIPDPLTWEIEPYAISPTRVGMVATTATDISGVEYYFECTSHAQYSSGWQDSPVYELDVAEGALYTFVVRARDKSANQNTTGDSAEVAADPDPPEPSPMTWAVEPYRTSPTSVSMTASLATDVSGVEYYFECTSHAQYSSGWRTGRIYMVSGLPKGQYTFVVRARDRSPARNTTGDSAEIPVDLNPPAPVAWEVAPYESGSGFDAFANMTAAEAIDAEGLAVEYYFECVDVPQFSSGWTIEREYSVHVGRELQGLRFRFRVRDVVGNLSAWSTTLRSLPPF